ncbi:iron ABC transporter substrate-binding protein [Moraxella osloensis]|nr:iron uptake system protein EfeO [Moraxella osloensis]MDI4480486.1 EfeM/EfeO family lipoprotein [Moraxella osloensis]BAV12171.1 iron ABC transporter substrate-binding protein [Moraxella osloensis]
MLSRTFTLSILPLAISALLLTACQKTEQKTDVAPAASATTNASAVTASAQSSVDMSKETAEYKAWVQTQIDSLLTDTQKFVALLEAGKLEEAKALYPKARMYFERSEPIAESFGDLDPRIDNREADLEPNEVWTGFHAIEKILWTQNTTKGTEKLGKQLIADVKELHAKIPTAEVTGDLMVQGSVDLLNEVSTSKITGEEEIFSHTDLYDFKANIEGAEKIFAILKPKIQAKNPALVTELEQKFGAVNQLLAKHQVGQQDYKSYKELTPADTKALAEAVNKLGEPLAQMGIVLQ